jgi:hypothetical protein
MFALETARIMPSAGEIETVSAGESESLRNCRRQTLQIINRFDAQLIGAHGGRLPGNGDQILELGVDLILKECGARGGAAETRHTLLHHHDIHARGDERVCHERTCHPSADDRDVAAFVAVKGL